MPLYEKTGTIILPHRANATRYPMYEYLVPAIDILHQPPAAIKPHHGRFEKHQRPCWHGSLDGESDHHWSSAESHLKPPSHRKTKRLLLRLQPRKLTCERARRMTIQSQSQSRDRAERLDWRLSEAEGWSCWTSARRQGEQLFHGAHRRLGERPVSPAIAIRWQWPAAVGSS